MDTAPDVFSYLRRTRPGTVKVRDNRKLEALGPPEKCHALGCVDGHRGGSLDASETRRELDLRVL